MMISLRRNQYTALLSPLLVLSVIMASTTTITMAQVQEEGWTTTSKGLMTVNSCYNEELRTMEFLVEFSGVVPDENDDLPWMAIGYRPTQECRMVTVDGASEIVLVSSSKNGEDLMDEPGVYHGALPALADVEAEESTSIAATYDSLVELDDREGFSLRSLSMPNETSKLVALHYDQAVAVRPNAEPLELMFAVGNSPLLGFHKAQGCFRIEESQPARGLLWKNPLLLLVHNNPR